MLEYWPVLILLGGGYCAGKLIEVAVTHLKRKIASKRQESAENDITDEDQEDAA